MVIKPTGIVIVILAFMAAHGLAAAEKRTDLLDFANGAVMLDHSSEYDGGWTGLNLIDSTAVTGWCSGTGSPFPHTALFELPQTYDITSVAVDNTGAQDGQYPGISAKEIRVFGSPVASDKNMVLLATLTLAPGQRQEVALKKSVNCLWLKFVVVSNHGHAQFTEIMELEAYGKPSAPLPKVDVTGTYQTNYDLLTLKQTGNVVKGCYNKGDGRLNGSLAGRVLQCQWWEKASHRTGSALLVLAASGSAINGIWFENGKVGGQWKGARVDEKADGCGLSEGLAERLAASGKAVVYGIHFDSDSAVPRPDSEATLQEILKALQAKSALKLQIAGHTDSTNSHEHNLKLSQNRAEAVVKWLVDHTVSAQRLTPKGFGETQPVANNDTAAGRALNRRVELIVQ